jgi:urease accessory protein UreF
MLDQRYNLPRNVSEVLGDLGAFAEQLGGAEHLDQLTIAPAPAGLAAVNSPAALEAFLINYASAVLGSWEIPAVVRAYAYAVRGQVRELVALDKELSAALALKPFALASAKVGQAQLRRLRPLRGERIVHRYEQAVAQGHARGWHTLVYGLVLAVYSIPLRQGAAHLAQKTLSGFVEAASRRCELPLSDQARVLAMPLSAAGEALGRALQTQPSGPVLVS